jgi:hypothetical protein
MRMKPHLHKEGGGGEGGVMRGRRDKGTSRGWKIQATGAGGYRERP